MQRALLSGLFSGLLSGLLSGLFIAGLAAAWLGGVALQMQQRALWPRAEYSVLCLVALALLGLLWARLPVPLALRRIGLCLALALLAFGSTGWRADARLAQRLSPQLEGQDLVLTGVVAQLPVQGAQGVRFEFEVEQARLAGQLVNVPPRVALGWARGFDGEALLAGPELELRAGQRWKLTVRLRQPHGLFNPHGFDLELWLFERDLGATGSVRATAGAELALLAEEVAHPVERWRQNIRDAIALHVKDPSLAGVLAALAVGDQAAIERADWDLFRATGVAHLMSISGLHITMFAWLAAALIGRLWRFSPRSMLAVPAPQAARIGGVLLAAAYALLAGWGVPAQRTVWMLATVALLRSRGSRWPPVLVLLAAAVVVTAIDPWALLQPGFWLSFAAVGLLLAAEYAVPAQSAVNVRQRMRQTMQAGLRTQLIASVGLAPLSLVFFHQISLVGFVANLVAIPMVTLLITPLTLLGTLLPPLWAVAAWVTKGLTLLLASLAQVPGAVWAVPAAPAWGVACGLLGGALLVLPLPRHLRLAGGLLLLPLLVPYVARPEAGQAEVVVVDIGQGTAVLVRTREHLLVYDSGPRSSPQSDAGSRVLLPLLQARGERHIDLLMLSHRDSDHTGGAAALLARGGVRAMSSSLEPGHPLLATGVPHTRCDAGQAWAWDGVHFDLLHPRADEHRTDAKPNTLSCVLRIQPSAGPSVLLTGDLEAAQELGLVNRLGAALKSEVLLVPHHGSKTSSTPEFLAAVAPQTALVQAAYRSRYGHPAPEVLARYASRSITVQRSDACGAWVQWGAQAAQCERELRRRYWHH